MQFYKIKSYAKINISLGILSKLKSKIHKIESLFSFIDLHDEIFIKKINSKNHKIIFYGKFSKGIFKNNTISTLLKLLDKKLYGQKYLIKINKKIPFKSGMGGGSMNASSLLKFLVKNQKLNLSLNEITKISSKIGSDVVFGLQNKTSILYGNGKIKYLNNKINLYALLIKPDFGCSTKILYKEIKHYSRPLLNKKSKIFTINKLSNLSNDLEIVALRIYPKLKLLKVFLEKLPNVKLVRMTGSGSAMIAYFSSSKLCKLAEKKVKKNFPKYWCKTAKTI